MNHCTVHTAHSIITS